MPPLPLVLCLRKGCGSAQLSESNIEMGGGGGEDGLRCKVFAKFEENEVFLNNFVQGCRYEMAKK